MAKIFSAADIIQASVNKNLEALLTAWQEEIEAAERALRERSKELNEQKAEEAEKSRDRIFEQAQAKIEASRLLHYVTGALNSAEANDNVSVTIPSGVQVASPYLSIPSLGNLMDIIGDLQDEVAIFGEDQEPSARQSALWALSNGYAPHAADLYSMLAEHDQQHPWTKRFAQLAEAFDSRATNPKAPAQLQGYNAHQQIGLLKEHINHLDAFGPKNLSILVSQPKAFSPQNNLTRQLPGRSSVGQSSSMKPSQFNKMLTSLFATKK